MAGGLQAGVLDTATDVIQDFVGSTIDDTPEDKPAKDQQRRKEQRG